jgi:hypothetical protein
MKVRPDALIGLLLLAGCGPLPAPATLPAPAAVAATEPQPVLEASPGSATHDPGPPSSNAMADPTSFDFAAELCSATWTNNGASLPCPGADLANSPNGYVALYQGTDLGLKPGMPVILTYPAQNTFDGIFGRYPAFDVRDGDQFYAHLNCLPNYRCDVQFGLDYYDSSGAYHNDLATWRAYGMDPTEEFIVDLSPLAGQRIEFVLALRPMSDRASAYALWINPVIISYQTPP